MEYTDYWVVRGDAKKVRTKLAKLVSGGVVMDAEKSDLAVFVVEGHSALDHDSKLPDAFDWLLGIWDAEGGAWGFELYVKGESLGSATYGENAEWGIDESMNGFEGDVAKAAKALGITTKKLESCLDDAGVEKLCKLVGFEHHYTLYPRDLPDEVMLLSEMT